MHNYHSWPRLIVSSKLQLNLSYMGPLAAYLLTTTIACLLLEGGGGSTLYPIRGCQTFLIVPAWQPEAYWQLFLYTTGVTWYGEW